MVRESDAAALVTEVVLALGRRGHDVAITHANGPRLVRLAALMLAEFQDPAQGEAAPHGTIYNTV